MKLKDLIEKYGEYEVLDNGKPVTTATKKDVRGFTDVLYLKKPKPKTVWDLEKGDKCYYIDHFGDVEDTGGYLRPISEAIDMGNVFLTKEEAEKDVERREVETLLLKHGGRRWFKNREYNYFLREDDHLGNNFWVDEIGASPVQGVIYFDTKAQAEKAIAEIGEERIKKALFEVR